MNKVFEVTMTQTCYSKCLIEADSPEQAELMASQMDWKFKEEVGDTEFNARIIKPDKGELIHTYSLETKEEYCYYYNEK